MLKKNELDAFKNTIKAIKGTKNIIEEKINSITDELENKIESINNLKNKFFESLDMKLQFVEIVLNNYEKKLENCDLNYSIINNLENQMNFKLLNLNFDNDASLEKKIENITQYLNRNISLQFNSEKNEQNEKNEIILENDGSKDCFKNLTNFDCYSPIVGILDFNKDLIVIYFSDSLFFISKKNFDVIFMIKEFQINNIKTCKKISDEKILIYTNEGFIFIKIIDNKDYIIEKKIEISYEIYDFNSNLDFLYFKKNTKYYEPEIEIGLLSFPDYKENKFIINPENKNFYQQNNRLQFNTDNYFFHISMFLLELYSVNNSTCSKIKSQIIKLDLKDAAIINSTNDFYYLFTKNMIVLLKKTDLTIMKSFDIS